MKNLQANTPQNNSEGMFPITSVCKDDMRELFEQHEDDVDLPLKLEMIKKFTEEDMKWLASKMADAYCNCCFWDVLEDRTEHMIREKRGNNNGR